MRRSAKCWFSTVAPNQMLRGHERVQGARRRARCGRLVSNNQSRLGVRSTRAQSRSRRLSRSRFRLEHVRHRGAEHACATAAEGRGPIPTKWLIPIGVAELPAWSIGTPDTVTRTFRPDFGVAVVARRGDLCAPPPRVERMARPFNCGVSCHAVVAFVVASVARGEGHAKGVGLAQMCCRAQCGDRGSAGDDDGCARCRPTSPSTTRTSTTRRTVRAGVCWARRAGTMARLAGRDRPRRAEQHDGAGHLQRADDLPRTRGVPLG